MENATALPLLLHMGVCNNHLESSFKVINRQAILSKPNYLNFMIIQHVSMMYSCWRGPGSESQM